MSMDIVLEDDNFDSLSCLKEELDVTSLCGAGAEFEVASIKNNFEDSTSKDFHNTIFTDLQYDEVHTESFEDIAKDFFGITEDDLVMKQVLRSGTGPVVHPASNVVVHYVAYLEYADEPFDSTRMRKTTFSFDLGDASVVEGFAIAVGTMRKKETSRFLVSPEYAYGSGGCPPRIPGDATCLYIIELIDFKTIDEDAKPYFNLELSHRNYAPLDTVLKAFNCIRNKAKDAFATEKYHDSHRLFSQALKILVDYNKKDEEEENLLKPELVKTRVNLALCNVKLLYSGRAVRHCNDALALDPENLKAHYFKGKALLQLGEFERSIRSLMKADSLNPGNKEIREELKKAEMYTNTFCNPKRPDHTATGGMDLKDAESKLDIFAGDKGMQELHLHSAMFSDDLSAFLRQESKSRDLLLTIFKTSSGETFHIKKKH